MKFKSYPRYKPSQIDWLGEVPEHWEVRKLSTISAKITNGYVGPTRDILVDKGVRYLQSLHIKGNTIQFDTPYYVTEDWSKEHAKSILETGDVLIVQTGDIGQATVVTEEFAGCNCHALIIVSPVQTALEGKWLSWILNSDYGYHTLLSIQTGALHPHLNCGNVKDIYIPLPPKDEQNEIAQYVEKQTQTLDYIITNQEKLIELLKEKRQAVISHAVTKGLDPTVPMKSSGVEWLGDVPEHWEIAGFTKYLGPIVDYRGRTPTKVDEGVLLLTARNIKNGNIDYEASQEYVSPEEYPDIMQRGLPQLGEVLFTMEAPLGQVANIDRTDIALAQRIVKFNGLPESLNNYFLKYWIMGTGCQAQLEQLATGSTALGIKSSKLGQIRMCFPPIPEQVAIAKYIDTALEKIDRLVQKAEQAIALQKEHRTALISAAVTGKIDVREAVADLQEAA